MGVGRPAPARLCLLACAAAAVVGCGGGEDRPDTLAEAREDPVALATLYGEAAATCDIDHARIAVAWGAGWTAYAPDERDPAYERRRERRARAALAACRRDVEPGSRVIARLERGTARDAVVRVVTVGPSGRSRAVRMRFANLAPPDAGAADWARVG